MRLDALGGVCEKTGGALDILDATALQEKLGALNAPILATNVQVTVRGSKGVTITEVSSGSTGSMVTSSFATVREATDAVYTFNVAAEGVADGTTVFLQSEIRWTLASGEEIVRVSTEMRETTQSREEAEKSANVQWCSVAALRECARLAHENRIEEGRVVLISTLRLLQRCMHSVESQNTYLQFVKQAEKLDGFLREKVQRMEVAKLFEEVEQNEDQDDYVVRNILQGKSLSLVDFSR